MTEFFFGGWIIPLAALQFLYFLICNHYISVHPRHNFVKRVCADVLSPNHATTCTFSFNETLNKSCVNWTQKQLWKIVAAAWGIMTSYLPCSQSEHSVNSATADSLPVRGCSSGGENFYSSSVPIISAVDESIYGQNKYNKPSRKDRFI